MNSENRRQPENAQLRAKIDHIQTVSQELQTALDQVHAQTVAWARQQKLKDLPSPELANELAVAFRKQRAALASIEKDIKGTVVREVPTQLVTDEELSALMK
jgi:hypothetical protein